jgi:hypothetical protein
MLQNRIYRGEISHEDNCYPGLHKEIIDEALWHNLDRACCRSRETRADSLSPVDDEAAIPDVVAERREAAPSAGRLIPRNDVAVVREAPMLGIADRTEREIVIGFRPSDVQIASTVRSGHLGVHVRAASVQLIGTSVIVEVVRPDAIARKVGPAHVHIFDSPLNITPKYVDLRGPGDLPRPAHLMTHKLRRPSGAGRLTSAFR